MSNQTALQLTVTFALESYQRDKNATKLLEAFAQVGLQAVALEMKLTNAERERDELKRQIETVRRATATNQTDNLLSMLGGQSQAQAQAQAQQQQSVRRSSDEIMADLKRKYRF